MHRCYLERVTIVGLRQNQKMIMRKKASWQEQGLHGLGELDAGTPSLSSSGNMAVPTASGAQPADQLLA